MTQYSDFFAQPNHTAMRQYEALRAYLYEGCSAEEAARRGNYTPGSFRNILTRFKKNPSAAFFWPQRTKSTPPEKSPNPRPARIVTLRKERGLSIDQIQTVLKQEKIPASIGYIYKIFRQHDIRRKPRTPKHVPRTVVADRRKVDLRERTFHTDFAGLFLFAFDLARIDLDSILTKVRMPVSVRKPHIS